MGERFKKIFFLHESFDEFIENQCGHLSVEPDLSPGHHANAFNKLFVTQLGSEKPLHPPSIIAITFSSLKRMPEDDGFHGRHFIHTIEDSFQIQGRHISQNGLFQEENIRPLLDHLLHEGNDLFRLALEIFDDDGAEEDYIFLHLFEMSKISSGFLHLRCLALLSFHE